MKKAFFILLALFAPTVSADVSQIFIAQDGTQFPVTSIAGSPTYQTDLVTAETLFTEYQSSYEYTDFTVRTIDSISSNYFDVFTSENGTSLTCFSSSGQSLGT